MTDTIADFLTGGADVPDPLLNDLKALVHKHSNNHPRSQQSRLGPSEVGHPCLRKLAQGLLFGGEHGHTPGAAPRINPPGDPLPSYVGVAAHARLEEAVAQDNARLEEQGMPPRWISERKVVVREDLSGTCDLYDVWTETVIDFKFPGTTAMTQYRKNGPSPEYKIQAHLYGAGYKREGYPVARVGIWFLPRAGQLATSHLWTEDYNQVLVDETLRRIDLAVAMIDDLDVDRHPERLAMIPTTTHHCSWCPWYAPYDHDSPLACKGDFA